MHVLFSLSYLNSVCLWPYAFSVVHLQQYLFEQYLIDLEPLASYIRISA